MGVQIEYDDFPGIQIALIFYNSEEKTLRNKQQIKADKKLTSEIFKDIENQKLSLSPEKIKLILCAVTFSYGFLKNDVPSDFPDDIILLEGAHKYLHIIEPVYTKFLPILESLPDPESNFSLS